MLRKQHRRDWTTGFNTKYKPKALGQGDRMFKINKHVKNLALVVLLVLPPTLLTQSCVSVPETNLPDMLKNVKDWVVATDPTIQKVPEQVTPAKPDPKELLTTKLVGIFTYIAIISILASVLIFAAGTVIPLLADLQLGRIAGGIALGSLGVVYAAAWIWWFIGVTFWGTVLYLGYRIFKLAKEKALFKGIMEELASNFDDTEGEDKLSVEAKDQYLINRHKGVRKVVTKEQ
jgi:hypothetical protein